MGGFKGPNYEKFRKKCVDIYQYLRNYAKLITNLFHLMIDSGLPVLIFPCIVKINDFLAFG